MSQSEDKLPRLLTSNLQRNVCTCYDVPKQSLIDAYHQGCTTFEELTRKTYACQGSACCQTEVEKLVKVLNEHFPDA